MPNYRNTAQGRRRKYLQDQTDKLIRELKEDSQLYSERIIYAFFGKIYRRNLYKKKTNKTTKKLPVTQYDKYSRYVDDFESISQAEKRTGIKSTSISMVINNKRITAGGFIWKPTRKS